MSIKPPNLDDRDYDDLVAEARSLIPRYLPEWTNHNSSDPGITLLQLFAWFTDQLVYRVNKVPELQHIALLNLLGVRLRPAQPATTDLTFTTATTADVIVPAGTRASAQGADGSPVVFELPEGFTALGSPLTAVQTFDGFAYRDVTIANDTDGQAFAPLGPYAHDDAALLLGLPGTGPGGLGPCTSSPVTLMVYATAGRATPVAQAGALAVPPPARLAYEFWDGTDWEPLTIERDETVAFTTTGRLVLFGPGTTAERATIGKIAAPLHWLRVRKISGAYERGPQLERVSLNTVPARAAVTMRDEVLGGSDGMPEQGPFTLSAAPVIGMERPVTVRRDDGVVVTIQSLRLEIDEGSGFQVWQEVDDLGGSGPQDPHYVLDRSSGEIRFGDGRHGAIPVANALLPAANVVARRWLTGGGRAGNVGSGTVTTLATVVPGIKTVTNRLAAIGGADGETLDEARLRAPTELKAKERAVTAEDFELKAREAPANVARAHTLTLVDPRLPGVEVPGALTVLVVPDTDDAAPRATPATLAAVCAHLDRYRLVTTEVFATCPSYRAVRVVADVVVLPDADPARVREALAEALVTYLHPLRGGDDGQGWPFGGTVYSSALFRVVLGVPGVARVRDNQLTVELDGERQPFCRDVEIGVGELIEPLDPDLRMSYS